MKNILAILFIFLSVSLGMTAMDLAPLLNYIKEDSHIQKGGTEIYSYNGNTYVISIAGIDVGSKNEQNCRRVGEMKAKRDMIAYINSSDINSLTNLTISETTVETLGSTDVLISEEFIETIKEKVAGSINRTSILGGWYSKDKKNYYVALYKTVSGVPNALSVIPTKSRSTSLPMNQDTESGKTEINSKISDIDINIPTTITPNDKTFALIIANENYQDVANVQNALNDGESFYKYCQRTLGIPEKNIHFLKNATLNNIKREKNLMHQIANAYNGEANFLIYYAGHGIPDESTMTSYLLPVDGYLSDLSSCYKLEDFYEELSEFPAEKIIVFFDACFSGSQRGEGMLQAARGVALKAKQATPKGKIIVFSSAQGDETAFPFEDQKHGLFTYHLLKNIKASKGNITLGELAKRIEEEVVRQSLVINGKKQTPSVQVGSGVGEEWKTWILFENN